MVVGCMCQVDRPAGICCGVIVAGHCCGDDCAGWAGQLVVVVTSSAVATSDLRLDTFDLIYYLACGWGQYIGACV